MTQHEEAQAKSAQDEVVKYFVNDEQVEHTFEKPPQRKRFELKVSEILESAGFKPAEDYELTRDADNHTYTSLDEEVPVANGDRFTATYKASTPAS